jgi:hypothetical protein
MLIRTFQRVKLLVQEITPSYGALIGNPQRRSFRAV